MMLDNTPFFIVGAGRSGTTLLRLILAGHSRLHIPPETWFVRPMVEELPLTGPLTDAQVERAVVLMVEDYRWPDMEIAAEELGHQAVALSDPRLVDIINIVYRQQLTVAGKQRFGDKTPIYIHIVPQLLTLYPGAKFIHLIRDGRDVAISNIEMDWDRYYERTNFEWTQAMDRRREYMGTPYQAQILEIRYEDLVSELETTVRNICDFLGEQFEPAMLEWQHLTALVPGREHHIHLKLTQPIVRDAVAVWRRKLNALECFAIESCLHDDLRKLGYPLRYSSTLWRPLLQVTGWVFYAIAPLLGRGTRYLKRHNLLAKQAYI
jgi:hypothetical protein